MKKYSHKKLDYVNVAHFWIRTSTLTLKEAIVLTMMRRRVEENSTEFLGSILSLEKASGISRHTIKDYIEKFESLKILNLKNGRYFFRDDFEKYIDSLVKLDEENEYKINPKRTYHSTYTCYHFKTAKELGLNYRQYFFIDIHIGLFLRKGHGTSPKDYTKRTLGIEERYYFKLKEQLFRKGYLEIYVNGKFDMINVSGRVMMTLGKMRDEIKTPNKKLSNLCTTIV